MLNSQKFGIELYENLGKLFYAMASTDGNVHTKEIDKLKSYIRTFWLDIDAIEDEYGSDAAFRIEATFDWCLEYEKDADESFKQFQEFYKEHLKLFGSAIKNLVLDTAHAMANSYAGKNKSELILLSKIELLFKDE
ncbi:hypothetical protein [Maribacter hydrothermalis]|uniref:Co-chaperone DjlA N-terminal domain-containing protein n=1 Tax=Maribacter hydrothermalis TaxID=1836467 RepID=A0A1B7YZG4_9FLAO|nr:hypothetical protein [Maribacter hydrothermalis]APQ16143.1 hypothetical protein BTR34_01725 [Maribacter hydrothermalis]OBR35680.1 hypothetical protein A9200_10790 [Maribacter hydrothermalis]